VELRDSPTSFKVRPAKEMGIAVTVDPGLRRLGRAQFTSGVVLSCRMRRSVGGVIDLETDLDMLLEVAKEFAL
jgi:hypothetical protein